MRSVLQFRTFPRLAPRCRLTFHFSRWVVRASRGPASKSYNYVQSILFWYRLKAGTDVHWSGNGVGVYSQLEEVQVEDVPVANKAI